MTERRYSDINIEDFTKPLNQMSQEKQDAMKSVEQQLAEVPPVCLNLEGARIVEGTSPDNRDIMLPNNKSHVAHIAVDIGGSLAKVMYYVRISSSPSSSSSDISSPAVVNMVGGRLCFVKFETAKIDECIKFMANLINLERQFRPHACNARITVIATGGGAYKFYEQMRRELKVDIVREDEMECLIAGLNFFINSIPREVFTLDLSTCKLSFQEDPSRGKYPHMLVNIGSGVSILKVNGPSDFERVGGSSLGGGTLWGLLSLLTPAKSYDEMLELSKEGDNSSVDMLVSDIYGANLGYERFGLKNNMIASSFGKVFREHKDLEEFHPGDIAKSLLFAVSNNIGQIAYLHAQRHNVENIYFGGSFIRNHVQTMQTLTYAIKFWSKNTMNAYFLRHEGYLGVVGAFLKYSWPCTYDGFLPSIPGVPVEKKN
ncbi:fumble family pantothenate kinase [Schizosaccharomyces japonicus yFS275]|uniref:pantothenate kinase n=1 Tax=Schizosaccharomyces japonicus (strain yFS275 / FY16936) TaxID=402676 RepID=B6JVL3_SCHJY|nr:fumble family pantothenate kinase [Schizosaccharomyces japonicus yFS275]EEB05414.1 fumble family pantothenate kinase [Schizosaccharomyces japonicus yFS275]